MVNPSFERFLDPRPSGWALGIIHIYRPRCRAFLGNRNVIKGWLGPIDAPFQNPMATRMQEDKTTSSVPEIHPKPSGDAVGWMDVGCPCFPFCAASASG